ncbi:MAG: pteridine reductase [Gammaproteobacteria bacterium]|nr:pteridine reductase [Gammaproteobacteria bacterium]
MTKPDSDDLSGKVVLITGAAHRIGATIARMLHGQGTNLTLHYRGSSQAAQALQEELNALRANSVILTQADLLHTSELSSLVQRTVDTWGRLDVLVNNASSFYPTPIGSVTEAQWDDLTGTNLKAPFFLAQAAAPHLERHHGCIVNIADIHADRPLKSHPVYSLAKAGLVMLTKALARELGPRVRVNAVAPGAILWPESEMDEETRQHILSRTALKRQGSPEDIARAVLFLIRDAAYTSGHVLTVDGGRSLSN